MVTTFVPETLDVVSFGQLYIDFKGRVGGLQSSGQLLDAGVLSFEYGTDSSLAAAQRVDPAYDQGLFVDVETSYEIRQDGLAPETEYFYRAAIQPVLWGDKILVDEAIIRLGFMEALGDNDTKLNEALANSTAKNEIFSIILPRTSLLYATYLISAIWSQAEKSEDFWSLGGQEIPTTFASGKGTPTELTFITNQHGGKGIQFKVDEGSGSIENYLSIELDLSLISTLIIETEIDEQFGAQSLVFKIDDTEIYSSSTGHLWTDQTFDVSGYSGNHILKIGYRESSAGNSSTEYLKVGAIKAQK